MPLTLKECVLKLKEIYPDMYPTHYIMYKGKYIFNALPKGVNKDQAIADFHAVDPDTGGVSSNIPLDLLMQDEEASNALKNPHSVPSDLQILEHGVVKIHSPIINSINNRSYSITRTSDYLMHHGIKGQKWGEKNGPPYPLDTKTHKEVIESSKHPDKPVGMDPEMFNLAFELFSLAAFTIGPAVYLKIQKNRNHKEWKKNNDAISEDYLSDIADIKEFSAENKPKEIHGSHTREQDMAAINPTYEHPVKGSTSNCLLCSVAYDMRRRGYDVTSKLCNTGMYLDKVIKEVYVDAKQDKMGAYGWKGVTRNFEKKYPEGTRGIISVSSIYGGHAMAFEIQNGKLEIYDAQCKTKRKLTDKELSIFDPRETKAVRVDNKEINWDNANIAAAELKDNWKQAVKKKFGDPKKKTKQEDSNAKQTEKVAAGVRSEANIEQIRAYKREHPGTQLSDLEILKNIYGK